MNLAITAFYLTLSAVAVVVAALSYDDRRHRVQVALGLLFMCGLSNATWFNFAWWQWPIFDAGFAWFVALRFRARPRVWKYVLVWIAAPQMLAHLGWHLGDKSTLAAYAYTATLNALFVVQLASTGSREGWERGRDRLRGFVAGRRDDGGNWRFALLRRLHISERGSGSE
jgi:hypothetical protein